jgi:beta-lactam-binding protein with PASTA domain
MTPVLLPRLRAAVLALFLACALTAAYAPPAWCIRSSETEAEVPNVKGKRQAEAELILKQAGFDSIQIYETDTDKRGLANVVRDQLPIPGKTVGVGVMIKLTVYRYAP